MKAVSISSLCSWPHTEQFRWCLPRFTVVSVVSRWLMQQLWPDPITSASVHARDGACNPLWIVPPVRAPNRCPRVP